MRAKFIIASMLISFLTASHATPSPTHIKRQAENNEQDRPTPTVPAVKTKTATKDETVIVDVTTVVVVAAGGSPNNQVMGEATVADENEETTFANQLEDDQEALHRTALILALVGGLIGIAIVASVVIFTKMRIRKRKKNQQQQQPDDDEATSTHISSLRRRSSSTSSSCSNRNNDNEPSAPPSDENATQVIVPVDDAPQPAPSAPTAKELDAAYTNMPVLYPMTNQQGASSSQECPHCLEHTPSSPPEMPPPAYTPTAPPLYALPPPSTSTSSASLSSETDTVNDRLIPSRTLASSS
ncbi:hypothetical protein BJV82DRAFT_624860 [Fennellomyces sp. T-0311]|nr:hypothetical protein BJV82DRAFT_624860 [Fennellomyces sp. T-0311]